MIRYLQISVNKETFRKTWNAKYTLRSHFDGVRALSFHPTEPVLVTASEDCTLKLWNLQKTIPAKKSASLDVEPVYTFRGHVGPVLCLAMSPSGEQCYRYWDYCDHEQHCDDGSDEGAICRARDYIVFVVPTLMLLVIGSYHGLHRLR